MTGLFEWLLTPLDPSRMHAVDWAVSWHGRLMVLAWLFAFPAGILTARFFKITPMQDWPHVLDNVFWWKLHLRLQYFGGACVLASISIAILSIETSDTNPAMMHHIFGWIVIVAMVVQFLGGWLRGTKGGPTKPAPDGSLRGDHYDMTLRRVIFERVHKSVGYLAVFCAWIAIALGLVIAKAPNWMALGGLIVVLTQIALFITFQRKGMARDTYQAIWGPGKEHPGNAKRPIGRGVRKVKSE